MKKITLLSSLFVAMFSAADAQYTAIVTNDAKGDAGMMGIDMKNVSYQVSSDKKNITFKFESWSAITKWDGAGFMFYFDDDMDPSKGIVPECNNKSLKADQQLECMNMGSMGGWGAYLTKSSDPKNSTDVTSQVKITNVDANTTTVQLPMTAVDKDGDGQFNMIVGAIFYDGSAFYVDDLPNTGYSSLNVFKTTSIRSVGNLVNFSVYPNPASNVINFTTANTVKGHVNVYDLLGKEVSSNSIEGTSTSVNVSTLAKGTYLYRVIADNNEMISVGKISVQ